MKYRLTILSLVIGLSIVVLGCARVTAALIPGLDIYVVKVNAYKSQPVNQSGLIYVSQTDNASNPILDEEVVQKLAKGLINHGYITTSILADSDYVLINSYAIDSGTEIFYETGSTTQYARGLVLHLYSTKELADNPKSKPIWIAQVFSKGRSTDLRTVLDYLLVAALEYFPQDTHGEKTIDIFGGDKRVKALYSTK